MISERTQKILNRFMKFVVLGQKNGCEEWSGFIDEKGFSHPYAWLIANKRRRKNA
jgi:hypothetical protein